MPPPTAMGWQRRGQGEEEAGVAAALSGLPPDIPEELLLLYFEAASLWGRTCVELAETWWGGGTLTFQETEGEGQPEGPLVAVGPDVPLHPCLQMQGGSWPRRSTRSRVPLHACCSKDCPPDAAPQHPEQHSQTLLRATGPPEQPCCARDSPRPDGVLAQLPRPLSKAGDMQDWGDARSPPAPSPTEV